MSKASATSTIAQRKSELLSMKDDESGNEIHRNIRLQHVDYENARGHRDQTTLLIEYLSSVLQHVNHEPSNSQAYLSFLPIS